VRVRFEREAKTISALQYAHIYVLYDIGKQADADFLVMEYLEGETLREQLRRGAMPVRKVVECAEQIAQGLAAAHQKGIIHRDLKPENVFITRQGSVKILDFGIAKLVRNESSGCSETLEFTAQTDSGTVLGTPGYIQTPSRPVRLRPAETWWCVFFGIFSTVLQDKNRMAPPIAPTTFKPLMDAEQIWR
jgi:eukaryotic-like serine/threonine-protein kinase